MAAFIRGRGTGQLCMSRRRAAHLRRRHPALYHQLQLTANNRLLRIRVVGIKSVPNHKRHPVPWRNNLGIRHARLRTTQTGIAPVCRISCHDLDLIHADFQFLSQFLTRQLTHCLHRRFIDLTRRLRSRLSWRRIPADRRNGRLPWRLVCATRCRVRHTASCCRHFNHDDRCWRFPGW
jgi:hypothetical protein